MLLKGGYDIENLPQSGDDPVWANFRKPPFNLRASDIALLKNELIVDPNVIKPQSVVPDRFEDVFNRISCRSQEDWNQMQFWMMGSDKSPHATAAVALFYLGQESELVPADRLGIMMLRCY